MIQTVATAPAIEKHRRPGFVPILNAERIKFFSLKAGPIATAALGLAIVLAAFMSSLSLVMPAENSNPEVIPITSVTPLRFVDTVLWMAIVYAVVAVLFATSEYTTKQIQVSFLAVPGRVSVVLAKACVIGSLGFVVGMVAAACAMLAPLVVLSASDVTYEFNVQEVVVLAVAAGIFMGLIGIVSLSFGLVVRNVIVAIAVPVLFFSIVPSILESIGNEVVTTIVGYLPSVAGRVILTSFENPAGLGSWPGIAVLAAWAVVLVALAGIALRVRDA